MASGWKGKTFAEKREEGKAEIAEFFADLADLMRKHGIECMGGAYDPTTGRHDDRFFVEHSSGARETAADGRVWLLARDSEEAAMRLGAKRYR